MASPVRQSTRLRYVTSSTTSIRYLRTCRGHQPLGDTPSDFGWHAKMLHQQHDIRVLSPAKSFPPPGTSTSWASEADRLVPVAMPRFARVGPSRIFPGPHAPSPHPPQAALPREHGQLPEREVHIEVVRLALRGEQVGGEAWGTHGPGPGRRQQVLPFRLLWMGGGEGRWPLGIGDGSGSFEIRAEPAGLAEAVIAKGPFQAVYRSPPELGVPTGSNGPLLAPELF
jgi:hypothetical protein